MALRATGVWPFRIRLVEPRSQSPGRSEVPKGRAQAWVRKNNIESCKDGIINALKTHWQPILWRPNITLRIAPLGEVEAGAVLRIG